MDPVVLLGLRGLVLILLYLFVARAVRAVLRDLRAAPVPAPPAPPVRGKGAAGRGKRRGKERPTPRELVVHQPDSRPRVISLEGTDEITFGRAETSTVILADPYVSERHTRVYRDGGEWLAADMGSTNGTLLNKVKVTSPTPIAPGDQLGVGRVTVEVRK
jgi:hypothetical protein